MDATTITADELWIRLGVTPTAVAKVCVRHGIAELSVFGSVLREDFGPESDVDLLVEFLPNRLPSLITLGFIEDDFAELLGRRVDLIPRDGLNQLLRPSVLSRSWTLYERA